MFALEVSAFTGGEIDTRAQGFTFFGIDVTQQLYRNLFVATRVVPTFLTYKYRSGGELIRAKAPGLSTVAGFKYGFGDSSIGVFGGTEFRHTNLNPDQKDADPRGNDFSGLVQGEFSFWLPTRTNFAGFVSFSGIDQFVYERMKIVQQVYNLDFSKPNNFNLGVEQISGRNDDFHQVGGGLIFELFNIPYWVAIGLRSGYKYDSTFGNGLYGGIEVFHRF